MVNFANGKIYSIRSRSQPDLVYVGSTAQKTLAVRFGGHKRDFTRWKNGCKSYCTSCKILEIGDAYIELIEYYPCETRAELNRREGEVQREIECVNKYVAGRTQKEWFQANKEHISKYRAQYRQANKEQLSKYGAQYRQANKERITKKTTCKCGAVVRYDCLTRHKKSKKHARLLAAAQPPP